MSERRVRSNNEISDGELWLNKLYGIGYHKTPYSPDGWVLDADDVTRAQLAEFIAGRRSNSFSSRVQSLLDKLLPKDGNY